MVTFNNVPETAQHEVCLHVALGVSSHLVVKLKTSIYDGYLFLCGLGLYAQAGL